MSLPTKTNAVALLLLPLVVLLSGCNEIEVRKFEQSPRYPCSGETIRVSFELTHKADELKIWDANGLLFHQYNVEKFDEVVENADASQNPFRVWGKDEISWWPDYEGEQTLEIEFYDDPKWIADIPFSDRVMAFEWQVAAMEDEGVSQCWCEYTPTVRLISITWTFGGEYSPRLVASTIENHCNWPIRVEYAGGHMEVDAGMGADFPETHINTLEVTGIVPDMGERVGSPRRWPRECDQLCPADYPFESKDASAIGEELFPEIEGSINLEVRCVDPS